ncbi:putative O-glycosylation ligase, exosortase A system-associated [Echinimonas agarilytica]|uniref:O-glycosylation ligase, exosortase A system-associated n=1 Tax=Echinimonas agarilytica TaxID=1215918 RepID=A0AA41W9B0_9GAMM|nr:putative O-glycosylation ligase, exosortase A system-associated [Echinimonas agarilytica]MCM2681500.1 putative O-glycosylation ligase, exosortase A system-associated [Echinimonas agarilytica]
MRDPIFLAAFIYLLYLGLKHPSVAVSTWLWVAMVMPKNALYGFGSSMRFNAFIALATIATTVLNNKKVKGCFDAISFMAVAFFVQMTLSSIFAENDPKPVWVAYDKAVKILLLYFFATALINTRKQLELFVLAMLIGLSYHGVIEGLKFAASGGGHRIHTGFMGDNNMLALALCMAMPLFGYFMAQAPNKIYRWAAAGCMLLFALSIMGTNSRGGFVGMAFLLLMNFVFAKKKLGLGVIYTIGIIFAVSLMQDQYIDRLNTIDNAAESDGSFMGRLVAWKVATLLALEHPFLGVGFYGLQNHGLFFGQAENYDNLSFIPAPDIYFATFAKAAHSIYFQVLSDHGFVGFFIYFGMIGIAIIKAMNLMMSATSEEWMRNLAKYVLVALMVFCLSGAALSFAYNDVSFALLAMVTIMGKIKRTQQQEQHKIKMRERELRLAGKL